MIRFRNFEKSYEGRRIISAPDLELDQPLYWLKGGNGAGKTTLLKSIAGLIPFKGHIGIGDKDIRGQPIGYRLAVNYAAAEPVYPEFLTGSDLIAFYKETKKSPASQVDELTSLFGIRDYINDKIGTYSSGMIKKLSLVLGFTGRPELILLDEPLITLDVPAVAALLDLMEARCRMGTQLLITSHQEVPEMLTLAPVPLFIRDHVLTLQL